jgi:hypothetical protein
MKHTQGDWHYKYDNFGNLVVKGPDGYDICEIRGCGDMEANAHLIAAAPELLEALVFVEERLTRSGYPDGPNLQTLRAAIAKATGE